MRTIIRHRAAAIVTAIVLALAGIALATGLVRVDHYAGAYGLTAGTDTAYASVDLVHGQAIVISWERAS